VLIYGIDARYAYSRTITGTVGVQQAKRDSNIAQYTYDDTRLMLQVLAQF